jgi:hypothetical protein
MKTAAVLPALGIGDALLMMIASHHLAQAGYQVTTFHASLPELSSWFPDHTFLLSPPSDLTSFDLVIAENDNSAAIKQMIAKRTPSLSIFYPTYSTSKHAPLAPLDRSFDPTLSMAENISRAIASLLSITPSKSNGITPPSSLVHRCRSKRILLHPTSRVAAKNWKREGFLQVAQHLKKRGFSPLLCVSPVEKKEWVDVEVEIADCPTLSALAALVFESHAVIGNDSLIGHLASNLNIPTVTIANDLKRMRLWRPDWHPGKLVLPPSWIPNTKGLRLREKYWQHFISINAVLNALEAVLKPQAIEV